VDEEVGGARKVLTAAAFTYIAVALYALIELLYWVWVLFGRNRD
jgi:Zn-dependent membrane protease YugP